MTPNLISSSTLLYTEAASAEPVQIISRPEIVQTSYSTYQRPVRSVQKSKTPQYQWNIVWRNVVIFAILHLGALYGLWLVFTRASLATTFFLYFYGFLAGLGITAGAHRLWAHRTYKAKLPLRIFLMLCQSAALQNHIYEWVRDHRVHHKFTDTDADPHNSRRGFFFSHMGWLLVRKHKEVFSKGKTIDFTDLEADPVVMFQKKYYLILVPILCFIIPAHIPWYFWNEDYWVSWYVAGVFRYVISLNGTWLVNSAAHIYGTKPYDNTINPTENRFVAVAAFGEGWHNFHHVFPWDYKAGELGNYGMNWTTAFLDLMAKIGWAYDLKTVTEAIVRNRAKRTGDGTWSQQNNDSDDDGHHNHQFGEMLWGWGDTDMKDDDVKDIKIYNKLSE